MEEIIKTLLLEGIDEATIHRVLDVIEEEYEVVSEGYHLVNVVDRADSRLRSQGKRMPWEKWAELSSKAIKIKSPNDYYLGKNHKVNYEDGGNDVEPKGRAEETAQKSQAMKDPKRKERKISVGKAVQPTSRTPERVGDEIFRQARIQRKLQKKNK